MIREIRLEPEALDEIVDAARWYDDRERGLGRQFATAVFERVARLRTFANVGAPVWGVDGVLMARQIRLRRFPYVIVYVVAGDVVRVVAIAHERQLPGYWASRLG